MHKCWSRPIFRGGSKPRLLNVVDLFIDLPATGRRLLRCISSLERLVGSLADNALFRGKIYLRSYGN